MAALTCRAPTAPATPRRAPSERLWRPSSTSPVVCSRTRSSVIACARRWSRRRTAPWRRTSRPPALVGAGVHAALWADHDRTKTQWWADQLRRAGHRALFHGIQHDPTGQLRAVTLFDKAGEHPPYDDAAGWRASRHALHTDTGMQGARPLRDHGHPLRPEPAGRSVCGHRPALSPLSHADRAAWR